MAEFPARLQVWQTIILLECPWGLGTSHVEHGIYLLITSKIIMHREYRYQEDNCW